MVATMEREIAPPALTRHEQEVLALLAEGLTDKSIGRRLGFAENTVKKHVSSLREKLGAQDRAHAVAIGFRRGLLD